MQWIGLTGPMGSGKSTVAEVLRRLGYVTLDADKIVHQILGPDGAAVARVLQTFGQDLRDSSGGINRRALGRLVFSEPAKLDQLEQILHPLVRQEVAAERARLVAQGVDAAFYDVPLLFEKKMEVQFDHILVVTAPEEMRRQRLKSRSKMSDAEFTGRSKHHVPVQVKEAKASALIQNTGDLKHLEAEVLRALHALNIPLPAPA